MEEAENLKAKKGRARNLVLHLHPPRVSKESIRFTLTFGLGGMAAVLFLLQVFTGILLRFAYIASPAEAYDSIVTLQDSILFGKLIRNLHHWSGIFFVLVTFLHWLRTFYTGAFNWERRWNWVIGIVLMVLAIFSNFTGYLLPWDQLAFWAITVSTSMLNYVPLIGSQLASVVRGGNEVGAPTLLIFYNFHTAILPITLVILMGFHFWRVRKNKGVVVDQNSPKEMVPADPDLVTKELTVGLVLIAFVLLTSIFFNAPLQERADPAFSPNPAKAPWYFMGVQELLLHFHPFFSAVLIPTFFLAAMFWLPFSKFSNTHQGIWFLSEKGKKLTIAAVVTAVLFIPSGVVLNEYIFDFEVWMETIPAFISNGLTPFILIGIILTAWFLFIKSRFKPDKSELILFIFTFAMTAYAMLTFIGIWFRGPGMVLSWP